MSKHTTITASSADVQDLTAPGLITAELITAADGSRLGVIDIAGNIGEEAKAMPVIDKIKALVDNGATTLQVRVTSYGGCLYSALAMYDALLAARQRGVRVTGIVCGVAASAATIVLMACEHIDITSHSEMMIHEPSTCIWGKVTEMQQELDSLRECWHRMCTIYAERTGQTPEEIAAAHDHDVWYTAEQAVAAKFADAVVSPLADPAVQPEPERTDAVEPTPAPEPEPAPAEKKSLFDAARELAARFGLCPPRKQVAPAATTPAEPSPLTLAAERERRLLADLSGTRALLAAAQQERAAACEARDAALADRRAEVEREVAARIASLGLPEQAELPAPVQPTQAAAASAPVEDDTVRAWLAAGQHDALIAYACRSTEHNAQVSRILSAKK